MQMNMLDKIGTYCVHVGSTSTVHALRICALYSALPIIIASMSLAHQQPCNSLNIRTAMELKSSLLEAAESSCIETRQILSTRIKKERDWTAET